MEEALMKTLKILIEEIFDEETDVEIVVDNFLKRAELTLSPHAREELIAHMQKCIANLPE